MPDLTLFEAAVDHQDIRERAVARWIVEASPIAELLPQKSINGAAYRYDTEGSLGTVAHRGVNGSYTPDAGVINPQYEPLVILGGEVTLDNFEVEQMSNLRDLKGERYRMKARAMGIKYSEMFFEGDTAVDPFGPDGARKRITGNQSINMGSGGGTLTLAKLDELLDLVIGDNSDKVLFMNDTMRRKILALVAAENGSFRIDTTQDVFHKTQQAYSGAQIRIIRREDDGSTFLGFDESDTGAAGGNLDTTSIYCMRFGMDYVHGLTGTRGMPNVKDFGETEARPGHLGRIEWYYGFAFKHPRAAARLSQINNA
jgi:hypothetical protein